MEAAKELLNEGDFKSALEKLNDAIAIDGLDPVKAFVEERLLSYGKAGNKAGTAAMQILKTQILLSLNEADDALKSGRESVAKADYVNDKRALEGLAFKVLVDACLLSEQLTEGKKAATDMLAAGQKYRDNETIAGAWHSIASVNLASDDTETAVVLAEKALTLYRELGSAKGIGSTLCTTAKIYYSMEKAEQGLTHAREAVDAWRTTPYTKDLASALDLVIQGCAMKALPMDGLRAANQEIELARQAGNKRLEGDLLEMMAQTRAMLGEPVGALKSAEAALEIFQTLQDKMGEGNMFLLMSEMLRARGQKVEATTMAEKAEKAFKVLDCKWGQAQARESVSLLLVERGQPEKAPKRADALKALTAMVKAIEKLNEEEFKKTEERVHSFAGLLTEQDTYDALLPIFSVSDPTTLAFLEKQGWEIKAKGEKTYIKIWDHITYYVFTILGGMNFGPQFRHVNPYRVAPNAWAKDYGPMCISVSQLPEADDWQQVMAYRPGYLDQFQALTMQGI